MPRRLQSPSSINTFKQCPRKYYYQYIAKLPTKPSIHTVRGNVAHSVLENLFDIDTSQTSLHDYGPFLKTNAQQLLIEEWTKAKDKFLKLNLPRDKEIFYFEETLFMLFNWLNAFSKKIQALPHPTFQARFRALTPVREKHYHSEQHQVRGYIDAIEDRDGKIHIMDYKTSSRDKMSDAYKLQLSIYALLYHEEHATLPHKVGIYFLKMGEKYLTVDQDMVDNARKEVAFVHEQTESVDINDYSLKPSPLCKWSTGQCDFYGLCFEQKKMSDFVSVKDVK